MRKGILSALLVCLLLAPSAQACPNENLGPPALTIQAASQSTFCLINERRRQAGGRKLRGDSRLQAAAQIHSDSMELGDYFAHASPGGGSPLDRIRQAGYLSGASAWGIGENIRWGTGTLATPWIAVQEWMRSPPHRRAMLDPSFRHVGVGVAIGTPLGPDKNGAIYTAVFGYRR